MPSTLKKQLDVFADVLKTKKNSDRKVRIIGHADASGTAAANQALSVKRAESVRDYLVTKGADTHMLVIEGVGSKDLKNPAFTPIPSLALADAFGSSTAAVKKPAFVCTQQGVGGDPAPVTDAAVCCYKMKGATLSPAPIVQTTDDLGTLQLRLSAPKLFCTPCTSAQP